MRIGSRGQSSAIDIALLTLIVIISITFLEIYSATHTSTSTKNVKDEVMDEYAQHALLTLSYVSPTDSDYSTVQVGTVGNVEDEDLKKLIDATLKIRNYTAKVDSLLENWSENVTAARDEIVSEIDYMTANISLMRSDLQSKTAPLIASLDSIESGCEELEDGLDAYGSLIAGSSLLEGDCDFVSELSGVVEDTTDSVDTFLSDSEDFLDEVKYNVDSNAEAALEAIQSARCVIREANVKMDYFITYAQVGLRNDSSLVDMMPAKANIGSKTVTEGIGESLYIEDRLAESGYIGTAASMEVKLLVGGDETAEEQILEGDVLVYGRKSYLELMQSAVENKFDVMLTKQGYAYCFTAKDCCSRIDAGDCASIPPNSARATRTINTLGNESAQMTLDIWRK